MKELFCHHFFYWILIGVLYLFGKAPLGQDRLISTSPSITESIFDLEMGHRLVGVSNYCQYPQEAKRLAKIGSSLTPDYEMILKLKPNLVLIQKSGHNKILNSMKKLNLKTEILNFDRLHEIVYSYQTLSKILGNPEKGKDFIKKIQKEHSSLPLFINPESYIIVTHSQLGGKKIKSSLLAGEETYYSDILNRSGLHNLARGSIPAPKWDQEKIIQSKPDWIFILLPGNFSQKKILAYKNAWKELKETSNLKKTKLRIIHGDFAFIPGPRIILLIKEFKKQILL